MNQKSVPEKNGVIYGAGFRSVCHGP